MGRTELGRMPSTAGDRGQVSVEAMGLALLVFVTVLFVWQAVLAGYSIMLASRAADRAARAAAVELPADGAADAGEDAGIASLPGAWRDGASITLTLDEGEALATTSVDVPLLLPGWLGLPLTVSSSSAARP